MADDIPKQSVDMDQHSRIVDICGTNHRFHELLLEATSYQHRQVDHKEILQNLRFLTFSQKNENVQREEAKSLASLPTANCPCTRYYAASTTSTVKTRKESAPILRLTEPGELAGCSHYIAVSYCWQQHEVESSTRVGSTAPSSYAIQTAAGCRPNRAPANIIHRAMTYAIARSCHFVWIDQECIDQDNPVDKERHIQAMHLIYRSAEAVVAVLNCQITKQAHIDVLDTLGVAEGHRFIVKISKSQLESVSFLETAVELAEIMAKDLWYTRAWTLHEAILASNPLHLLIPYHPSLTTPDWTGTNSGQLVLSEAVVEIGFVRTFFWRLRHWEAVSHQIATLQTRARAADTTLRETIPDYKTYETKDVSFYRQAAVDAVQSIVQRGISQPSDFLAIIGNLCQYSIRLDTRKLRDTGFSFTVSIFALALLNGDMSLVLALERKAEMYSATNTVENIWCSLPKCSLMDAVAWMKSLSRESHPYDCRIRAPSLTHSGLQMSGFVWEFSQEVDLECVKHRFLTRWQTEGIRFGLDQEIFWATLEYLYNARQIPLLQGLFRTSRFSVPESASQGLKASLETIHSLGGILSGEQWLVSTIMSQGKIYYGTMAKMGCVCLPNQQAYILLKDPTVFQQLFTPCRALVIAELRREVPNFLLSWKVHIRNPQLPMNLKFISRSFTISCQFPPLRDICVVGYTKHFLACPGQLYNISVL